MLVEGLADTISSNIASSFADNTSHAEYLLKPAIIQNSTTEEGTEELAVRVTSVDNIETPESCSRASSSDIMHHVDHSSASGTHLSGALPNSRGHSASFTSGIPERQPRQMARRGGRAASSSRPQTSKKKVSIDYTQYAGSTSVRAAINASKAAMKETQSPVLPSESDSSESESSSSSSGNESDSSSSSSEDSDSDSEGPELPDNDTFRKGAKFADYEAVEKAIQLWHVRAYKDSTKGRFLLRRRQTVNKPNVTCKLKEKRSLECPFSILFHPKGSGYVVAKVSTCSTSNVARWLCCVGLAQPQRWY